MVCYFGSFVETFSPNFHDVTKIAKSAKCPPKLGIRYLAGFVQYRKTSDGDLLKHVDPVQSTSYEVAKLTDNKQQ